MLETTLADSLEKIYVIRLITIRQGIMTTLHSRDQIYVLTELFADENTPQMLFSTFLPGEMLPTT